MKLSFPKIEVSASDTFKTKNFGFGDKRVIINILRSKMYSDPIAIICQEILSNCRDAHREVDKEDVPCLVKLPTKLDETIHFVDYGPGITPDRMENVFILYGNSTKRIDNIQTGGFGLGAKTPFSYTDSFSITTITDDAVDIRRRIELIKNKVKVGEVEPDQGDLLVANLEQKLQSAVYTKDDGTVVDKRYKREYVAYIDDSQIGAISLVKTTEVGKDTSTGTTISVPVKHGDGRTFIANIKRTAEYWDTRPKIARGTVDWENEKVAFEGSNWFITESDRYFHYYHNRGEAKAIIDGIQYRMNFSSIYDGSNPTSEERALMQRNVRFKFETGELDITANREDLDYQPKTISVIQQRVKDAIEELREKVNEAVKNSKNLWDAIIQWEKVSHSYSQLLVQPKWNGHSLFSSIDSPRHPHDDNIRMWIYNREDTDSFKILRSRWGKIISIDPKWLLVEDDVGGSRPHPDRIRTLFIQNQNIAHVGVVQFVNKDGKDHFESAYAFSKLDATKLSTVIKTKKPKAAASGGGKGYRAKIANLKRLRSRKSQRGRSDYIHEWVPANDKTTQDGGVYVKIYCGDCYLSDGTKISKDNIYSLANSLSIEVYGILSRTVKKLGPKWVNLLDYVNTELDKLEKDTDIVEYLKVGENGSVDKWLGDDYWAAIKKCKGSIKDMSKALGQWIEATERSISGREKFAQLTALQSYLKKPKTQLSGHKSDRLDALKKNVIAEYPLIYAIKEAYIYGDKEDVVKEFILYVNMKDS